MDRARLTLSLGELVNGKVLIVRQPGLIEILVLET